MSFAVSTSTSQGKSGRIVQVEKLPPSPQCKVLTVSLFVFFKLFGRLPVISFSELLLVRHIFAPDKETPQVWKVRAPVLEWLADETARWEGRLESAISSRVGAKNLPALDVVPLRHYLSNQMGYPLAAIVILLDCCHPKAFAQF